MKRLIFFLMAMALSFTVASARDVGTKLQTDVGIAQAMPVMQQPVTSADFLFAAIATQPTAVVQVRAVTLPVTNLLKYPLYGPPAYWQADYGNYRLIRNTDLQTNTNPDCKNTKGNTRPIETAARHVL